MANTGSRDRDIYENGEFIGVIAGGDAQLIEAFVKHISDKIGVRMDWYYVGGCARVLALGDIEKAREGLRNHVLLFDV